ncbi:MAG TPA: hypothetical protein VHB21_27435 [Minicystis sp.]|nr:hypothetical protein [Minicystis sp.]
MRVASRLTVVLLSWASFAAGGCSSDKPPETPAPPAATDEPAPPPADTGFAGDAVATETVKAPPPPKMTGDAPPAQPDDYTVTEVDCSELGKAYGNVTRSDLEAQLSPKLSAKQRATAERSIGAAARKMENQAANTCRASMLGKVTDRSSLKCALDAKTAKEFDRCLNGDAAPAPKKK